MLNSLWENKLVPCRIEWSKANSERAFHWRTEYYMINMFPLASEYHQMCMKQRWSLFSFSRFWPAICVCLFISSTCANTSSSKLLPEKTVSSTGQRTESASDSSDLSSATFSDGANNLGTEDMRDLWIGGTYIQSQGEHQY